MPLTCNLIKKPIHITLMWLPVLSSWGYAKFVEYHWFSLWLSGIRTSEQAGNDGILSSIGLTQIKEETSDSDEDIASTDLATNNAQTVNGHGSSPSTNQQGASTVRTRGRIAKSRGRPRVHFTVIFFIAMLFMFDLGCFIWKTFWWITQHNT